MTQPVREVGAAVFHPWEFQPAQVCPNISSGLNDILRQPLGGAANGDVSVSFTAPSESFERAQLLRAITLGGIVIRWSGSDHPVTISLPWPHEGVFLLRSDGKWRVDRWRWQPRLILPAGVHFLSGLVRHGLRGVAVADRRHRVTCKVWSARGTRRPSRSRQGDHGRADTRHPPTPVYLDPQLRAALIKLDLLPPSAAPVVDWRGVEKRFKDWCFANRVDRAQVRDAQDIRGQRLYTYGVHVEQTVLRGFARLVARIPEAMAAFSGQPMTPGQSVRVWDAIAASAATARWIDAQLLVDEGLLVRFDPLNGIAAIADLTAFQRYDGSTNQMERAPAWKRQNHPSFEGLICPVESPETKKVGITLHLAAGCRVTARGELRASSSANEHAADGFGHAASMVPFAQHNDGVRCMMGAKNLKQAVPVRGAQAPALLTGSESRLRQLLQPLQDAGLLGADEVATCPGTDLLVAYLPWYGWNADDAIVAHERLRDVLSWEYTKEHDESVLPGVHPCDPPDTSPWAPLQRLRFEGGLRKSGSSVGPDDPVAWMRHGTTGFVQPVTAQADAEAVLESISFHVPPRDSFGGHLSWSLRHRLPLDVGDKLMGRHGNKGVVSILLPDDRLPRLPNDDVLPPALRGRAVDLILNPNGVVSRMNLGQLIETHAGLLRHIRPELNLAYLGAPFVFDDAKQKLFASLFEEIERATHGIVDRYGRVRMVFPSEERQKGVPASLRAVAGFQYFVRLQHIPVLKAHARRGGQGYPYNLTTGQPVAGRRQRGGQRFGEMEVWALEAHQAKENLSEVLGPRSDPTWTLSKSPRPGSPTFLAVRDYLRGVGIALERRPDGIGLRLLSTDEIAASGSEITSDATWQIAIEGKYGCAHCEYRLDGVVGTRGAQRKDARQPSIADVIRDRLFGGQSGFVLVNAQMRTDELTGEFVLPTEQPKHVAFQLSKKKRSMTVRFRLNETDYAAYQQVDGQYDARDSRLLLNMRLTCPEHSTSFLELLDGESILWPVPGGVCDPELVGGSDLRESATQVRGFIRLPFAARNPLNRGLPTGATPLPGVECIPVLPLRLRHASAPMNLARRRPPVDTLTRIYADLVAECTAYRPLLDGTERPGHAVGTDARRAGGLERRGYHVRRIQGLVDAVYRHIIGTGQRHGMQARRHGVQSASDGRLFGKMGLLRHDGLGRRVDMSGRLVIVPDPTLDIDECRLPHLFLLEILLQDVFQNPDERQAMETALRELASEHLPSPVLTEPDTWRRALGDRTTLVPRLVEATRPTIENHIERDAELRVLLNRQPTLHRYNLLAFRPKAAQSVTDAPVLRLSPLVCNSFNADFDGDEMAIHAPIGSAARRELHSMTPGSEFNRLSLADSAPVIGFGQELALGHFLVNAGFLNDGTAAFEREVLVPGCSECSQFVTMAGGINARHVLKHLLSSHRTDALPRIKRWANLAWDAATRSAIGFGWLEVAASAVRTGLPEVDLAKVNERLEAQASETLQALLRQEREAPGFGLAALVLSGARGSPEQVRQILGPRGWLSPGDVGSLDARNFTITSSLATGMNWDDFFRASFNARSSMVDKKLLVAQAGALTRRLVLACWPWRIGGEDCGTAGTRSPILCRNAVSGPAVCSGCYGDVEAFGGRLPHGFPVGVIAAQSIGERGTQLSMQSFHTGERKVTPQRVVDLFERKGRWRSTTWYETVDGFGAFLDWVRQNVPAYGRIDDRHFAMVWLAIHRSPERSLKSAWRSAAGPVGLLAGSDQLHALIDAIGKSDDFGHPVMKIMAGLV